MIRYLIKIVSVLFIFSMGLTFLISATSEDNQYHTIVDEIAPYNFDDGISRLECIIAIMKVVGVDECTTIKDSNADRMVPVFADLYENDYGFGYVYQAKMNSIVYGIDGKAPYYQSNSFAPERNITVQETLTAMLRCLNDPTLVIWDNVMVDSVKFGLLKEEELNDYVAKEPLNKEQFYTLMCRFLGSIRYRYFPLESQEDSSWGKIVVTDTSNNKLYIDWYLEVKSACKDCKRGKEGIEAYRCANKNCPAE